MILFNRSFLVIEDKKVINIEKINETKNKKIPSITENSLKQAI